ncbi:hypothetical protein CPB83DRAFT_919742 [Crepidotus variabilis]|uniref:Integrase core domain-containing protein n=1 Tax=Crepidotus variabilis TaxID=179855 RepID=A0A9P6EL61_9AGAR|nr:hypothetical protein CPB83DRAFT_919742 [Crepidotus variabilis]
MSFNRNPSGRNQHGTVPKSNDPLLRSALEKYHRERVTNNVKISARLAREYNIAMTEYSVKRRRKELGFLSGRYAVKELTWQEMAQLILDVLDEDPTNGWGVGNVQARVAFKHATHLPKQVVSDVMHTYAPEGFEKREPGAQRIVRVPKVPVGIHKRWAANGHDKLYSIGFPIWAIVDDATGKWLGAWVVPSNRMSNVVAYLFLSTVEKYEGLPLQFSTDCGSETTGVYGLMNALREAYHPEIDPSILRAHEYVWSVHNISIEQSWLRLRLDWGNNAVPKFHEGAEQGIYDSNDPEQYELGQWLWSRLLQQELDQFVEFRNGARMRKDAQKAGPSGMSRNEAFSLYKTWGGRDCLLPVDCTPIKELKEELGGETLLQFVSDEYALRAESVLDNLGVAQVTMQNVWDVFQDMLRAFCM